MKKEFKRNAIWIIIVVVIIPLIVVALTTVRIIPAETDNDWIGFWGSYFGSLASGFIALYILFATIQKNKEERIRNEKIDFYNKLIEKVSSLEGDKKRILVAATSNEAVKKNEKYLNAIIEYNSHIAEIALMLKIEQAVGRHLAISEVVKSFEDYADIGDKLLKDLEVSENKSPNEQVNILLSKLTAEALLDHVKKFVVENIKDYTTKQ